MIQEGSGSGQNSGAYAYMLKFSYTDYYGNTVVFKNLLWQTFSDQLPFSSCTYNTSG